MEKQPLEVFFKIDVLKKYCRKIPVLESLWSLQACNLSRNRL